MFSQLFMVIMTSFASSFPSCGPLRFEIHEENVDLALEKVLLTAWLIFLALCVLLMLLWKL
jgi:hypothetical protein